MDSSARHASSYLTRCVHRQAQPVVGVLLSLAACVTPDRDEFAERTQSLVEPGLEHLAVASDLSDVIVMLRVPVREVGDVREDIADAQSRLVARAVPGLSVTRRYAHVPAVAATATHDAIVALGSLPEVSSVQRDHPGAGQLREAVPAIGADVAQRRYAVTGRGVRVAILDTGADTTHADLREAIVAQHCFARGACAGGSSEASSAVDDHGHGSHVAGIVASRGHVSPPGFAPDAELVVLKVNDSRNAGRESDWVAGLDWLADNHETLGVRVVNLSLGTTAMVTGTTQDCDREHPALASAVANLTRAGISVFAASGNRGSTSAMPAPACNSGVIAVGATYDSSMGRQPPVSVGWTYAARWGSAFADCSDEQSGLDRITCFTNATSRLDLVAPGGPIVSDSVRGSTDTYWGTSQASPVAAGVAALMFACRPTLTPAEVRRAMLDTGLPTTDSRTGLVYPALRADNALAAVCEGPQSTQDGGVADPGTRNDSGAAVATASPLPDVPRGAPLDAGQTQALPIAHDAGPQATPQVAADAGAFAAPAGTPSDEGGCSTLSRRANRSALQGGLFALLAGALLRRRRRGLRPSTDQSPAHRCVQMGL
jgi:subtilisin family serine protease